jgi:hypothetical protein
VRTIAEVLHADLAPSLAALRAYARQLSRAVIGADATPIGGVRRHSAVISALVEHLVRFHDRPRQVEQSSQFAAAVCRELVQQDASATMPRLIDSMRIDASMAHVAGPVPLAPLVAALLRAHLRPRVEGPAVSIDAGAHGITLSYAHQTLQEAAPTSDAAEPVHSDPVAAPESAPTAAVNLPLRLAALALQPWSWSVTTDRSGAADRVLVSPAATRWEAGE